MEPEEWRASVGAMLRDARKSLRMSKRAAAAAAGFSEALWRQLEEGERQVAPGMTVPVNPRDDTLEAAARAVLLDPSVVFAAAGRDYIDHHLDIDERRAIDAVRRAGARPVPYDPYGELEGLTDDERRLLEQQMVEMARAIKRARGIT